MKNVDWRGSEVEVQTYVASMVIEHSFSLDPRTLKFLESIIDSFCLLQMDDECDEHTHATVIVATSAALTISAVIMEAVRAMHYIPREPQINRDSKRESYINSILCKT